MATINLNTFPYYDDFSEDKNFHRVLFKPGYAVQARELTQLQTILQDQIKRFGDHIFKNGSVVLGCEKTENFNMPYVKILDTDNSSVEISNDTLSAFETKTVSATSGVRAVIKKVATGLEGNDPDLKTLYLQYTDAGTNNSTTTFLPNDVLTVVDTGETFIVADVADSVGQGSLFSVGDGIVYYNGNFVLNNSQTIILDRYATSPTKKVGYIVKENIITADDDVTLLDPARGSYNYAAPGADRYNLVTEVTTIESLDDNPDGFVLLFEIENGIIKRTYNLPLYGELSKTLAQRTYDESGDYTVRNFPIVISEDRKTATNNGYDPEGEYDKLAVGIQPGKAYVKGYEYELLATDYLKVQKGTDTQTKQNVSTVLAYDNYVIVSIPAGQNIGMFPINGYQTIFLRNNSENIGTARIKSVEYEGLVAGSGLLKYRLYLYDIQLNPTFLFSQITYIKYLNNSAPIVSPATQPRNPTKECMVFKSSSLSALKSVSDISYSYRATVTNVSFSSNQATVTAPDGGTWIGTETDFIVIDNTGQYKNNIVQVQNISTSAVTITLSTTPNFTGTVSGIVRIPVSEPNAKVLKKGRYVRFDISDKVFNNTNVNTSTNVITITSHNLSTGMAVRFAVGTAGGAVAPTGLQNNTIYYVIKVSENEIKLATTLNNALNSEAIAISTQGTGQHTFNVHSVLNLGFYDVFKIQNVWASSAATWPSNPATNTSWLDKTSLFRLDNGQRDSKYDLASITASTSFSTMLSGAAATKLIVKLDYFEHGTSSPYYTVNSYNLPAVDEPASETQIEWYELPRFTSSTNQKVYELRDCIDFRPTVQKTSDDSQVADIATLNPAAGTTYTAGSKFPAPDLTFDCDIEYFLPRIDAVGLSSAGEFVITGGISGLNPTRPPVPNNSMTLGYINIPPYPSLSPYAANVYNQPNYAARVTSLDNRRYTMKDIGDMKKRIDNLEYYTSLSLLESSAANTTIISETTLEDRFKNGIFVDPFVGHNIGNVNNERYNCSISNGELRPAFKIDNVELQYNSGSNVRRKNSDYIIVVRSSSTQLPFAVDKTITIGSTTGTIIHSVLLETKGGYKWERLYLHNVTSSISVGANIVSEGKTGVISVKDTTEALSMSTTKDGQPVAVPDPVVTQEEGDLVTLDYTHRILTRNQFASTARNVSGNLISGFTGALELIPSSDIWFDQNKKVEVLQNPNGIYNNWESLDNAWETHWGNWETLWQGKTSIQESIEKTGGDVGETPEQRQRRIGTGIGVTSIVSDVVIPYMRSRIIRFKAKNLRPNVTVYAYFDKQNVTQSCRINSVYYSGTASSGTGTNLTDASSQPQWVTNQFANYQVEIVGGTGVGQKRTIASNTTSQLTLTQSWTIALDNTSQFKILRITDFGGSSLTVDANGNLEGDFRIPEGTFTVGSKIFLISDNPVDPENTTNTSAITVAAASYTASGLSYFDEGGILSTQNSDVTLARQLQMQEPGVLAAIGGSPISENPLAQTFRISNAPQGTYLTKIDLYFKRKSQTKGITLQLREVVGGKPSDKILPYSKVTLEPKDINVSENASSVTQFVFKSPVYVKNDTEYCFVLLPAGNVDDYQIFTSRLGQPQIGTSTIIDEQPNAGKLFITSSNEWVELNNEDVKFTVYSTQFETTGSVNLYIKNYDYVKLSNISEDFEIGDTVLYTNGKVTLGKGKLVYYDTLNDIAVIDVLSGSGKALSPGETVYLVSPKYQIPGYTLTVSTTSPNISAATTVPATGYTLGTGNYIVQIGDILVTGNNDVIGTVSGTPTPPSPSSVTLTQNASINASNVLIFRCKTSTVSTFYKKYANAISPCLGYLDFNNTDISWSYSVFSESGGTQITTTDLVSNGTVLPIVPLAVFSKSGDATLTSESLKATATLTTQNSNISPVIDLSRLGFIIIGNELSTIPSPAAVDTEENSDSQAAGSALSKYISKTVTLEDGQEAQDLRVYLTALIPPSSDIVVYAKLLSPTDATLFANRPWTKLNKNISSQSSGFSEYYYTIPTASTTLTATGGILTSTTDPDPTDANIGTYGYKVDSGETYLEFQSFAIKIVLYSNSRINVPIVRDMRAIALQS